jgi:hypothetical protein
VNRKPWWDCEPVLQSKEQERKPLTYSGARPISIPIILAARIKPLQHQHWEDQGDPDGARAGVPAHATYSKVRLTGAS